MSTDKIKASVDGLSIKLKSLRDRLKNEGASLELFSDRQSITSEIIEVTYNTRGTKFENKGKKLNKDGGQVYRDILSNIKSKTLIEAYHSKDQYIKRYAAEVLIRKYDYESGVSKSWLNKNKENYFEWAEASILGSKKNSSDVIRGGFNSRRMECCD